MIAQLDKEYMQFSKRFAIRRVASYLLFEGRPHTTKGQWINPFVRGFLNILAAIPGNSHADRPIYITGLGRSGTTILGKLLSLHKDVGFLNEPKLMWAMADAKTDVCADYVSAGGRFCLEAVDAQPDTARMVNRILSRYTRLVGVSRAVDKYPEFIFRIDYLKATLPDAKIIFIARNGIDAVASVANWSQVKGVQKDGQVDDWWGRGDIKWTYLCEQILTVNPDYSDVVNLGLNKIDHANRAALEWIVTMRQGLQAVENNPDLVYRINYEELVEKPREQLTQLMQACELSVSDTVLDYAEKSLYTLRKKPMPDLHAPVAALFESTMREMGYGDMLE
ncbi:MAG: sulfotransferase [Gammaproteobacteria bacterium]